MDAQFEIKTKLEKGQRVEYYRFIWRKRLWLIAALLMLGTIYLLVDVLENFPDWPCALFCVAYSVFLYFRPWIAARKAMKLDNDFYGSEKSPSVTKFSDAVYDEDQNESTMIPYDKIKDIYFGKTIIVLTEIRRIAIIMDRDGFEKGNFEDFLPFIQQKCPQAKIYK